MERLPSKGCSRYANCLAVKAALEVCLYLPQQTCSSLNGFKAELQDENQARTLARSVLKSMRNMAKAPPDCRVLRSIHCRHVIGRVVEGSKLANLACIFCRHAESCSLCASLLEVWRAVNSMSFRIWEPAEEVLRTEEVEFTEVSYVRRGGRVYAFFREKARSMLQAEALRACLRFLSESPPSGRSLGDAIELGVHAIGEALRKLAGYEWFREVALEAVMMHFRLHEIYPLIANPRVTEVYGTLGHTLYFDHIHLGRCDTRVQLTKELYDRILSIAELDPYSWLDEKSPSLKTSIETRYFKLRITVDGAPLAEPSVDIRNLTSMQLMSLPTLISIGSISYLDAAKMLKSLASGANILVAGPTGSGKTTLCNALLVFTDPSARIISIEGSREIEDMSRYGKKHHIYVVPPAESGDKGGKWEEVIKLLHRNPDVVFLGELQHQMHVDAFFTAVESGFQVMATTHARSLEELREKWTRWNRQFDPYKVDVVVTMEKNGGARRVATVYQRNRADLKGRERVVEKMLQILKRGELPNIECARAVRQAYYGDDG